MNIKLPKWNVRQRIKRKSAPKGKRKRRDVILQFGKLKITINKKAKLIWVIIASIIVVFMTVFIVNQVRDMLKEKEVMRQVEIERIEKEKEEKEKKEKEIADAKKRTDNIDGLQQAWESMWLNEIELTADNTSTFVTMDVCNLSEKSPDQIIVEGTLPGIPESDSDDIYLFSLNTYETEIAQDAKPLSTFRIEKTKSSFSFQAPLNYKQADSQLLKKFVIAAKKDNKYIIISKSRYITNPEVIAKYNTFTKVSSKKGLLVDPAKMNTGELEDLGVKQAAYNIPIGRIMGQTTSAIYPTINYTYNGKTYAFNGQTIAEYDLVFGSLSAKGIQITAILLNDMNGVYPEIIHPQARSGSTAPYYMFNASDASGVNCLAAVGSFLAERYSSGSHGKVSNWVIANEINARKEWNYMQYTDVNAYTKEYAQAFRVFYNAIRSVNASAQIYMPLDQTWNRNLSNSGDYDAKDVLDAFNSIIREKGNIDWHLSHHPYPVPLTNAAFWNTGAYYNKLIQNSVDTPMICMKNINVITDYLQHEDLLTDSGEPRSVLLSEIGFTSLSGGEAVQAAAYAYAYYITEANSHIDGLLLNRETDAAEEISQGLAFGLCNTNGSHKQIYQVFKKIDTSNSNDATEFAKGILGISDWSEVIRNY